MGKGRLLLLFLWAGVDVGEVGVYSSALGEGEGEWF